MYVMANVVRMALIVSDVNIMLYVNVSRDIVDSHPIQKENVLPTFVRTTMIVAKMKFAL